jgi:hypothetical protein
MRGIYRKINTNQELLQYLMTMKLRRMLRSIPRLLRHPHTTKLLTKQEQKTHTYDEYKNSQFVDAGTKRKLTPYTSSSSTHGLQQV